MHLNKTRIKGKFLCKRQAFILAVNLSNYFHVTRRQKRDLLFTKISYYNCQMITSFMRRMNISYVCLFYLYVNLYIFADSVCSSEMSCRQVLRNSR